MKTKSLFILIKDGGDGSCYLRYTFNRQLIEKLQTAADNDTMDYENGIGMDGDGFHYYEIQVPEDFTAETLGLTSSSFISDDYADKFAIEDDD